MPKVWFIKYFDPSGEDMIIKTEFFLSEKHAKERRDYILECIKEDGGEKSDWYFKGGIDGFRYTNCNNLLNALEELNEIFST